MTNPPKGRGGGVAPRKSPPVSFARETYPPGGAGPSPRTYSSRSGAPLPKIFWGIFFSGVLGFLDARRGRAGPSPPLYGPDFLTIPSQNFLESKTELEATEMNPRTAMICIACARISDRDVVDAGRG